MATSDSSSDKDRIAWQVLQKALSQNEHGQDLLARLHKDQYVEENEIIQWLQTYSTQAPPQLKTYVSGGQVEKLINIAQAGTVLIQQSSSSSISRDSFCGLLRWIHQKSSSFEQLKPCYGKEVLIIIRRAYIEQLDFTLFELKVLDLVFNYCHYYLQGGLARSFKFREMNEAEDYYLYMNKLIAESQKVRSSKIKLSLLIKEHKMSELVRQVE